MNTHASVLSCEMPLWSAVFSLFMGVTSLIAAEFIPVSLLTPIAHDLNITEGMAGQAVTVVGAFAMLSSLLIVPITKNIDRKFILLGFSLLLVVSNLLVAMAPSYSVMLAARSLLGICVGGFWALVPAVVLQIVPAKEVGKALSVVYAGVSVATIISLPLASYLGHVLGWRNVFVLASAMGGIMFIWQWLSMPSLPATSSGSFRNMFALFRRGWVLAGMGAMFLSYGGYHIFFTYLRPFLEYDLALQPDNLASALLAFGICNCLGTLVAGFMLDRWFRQTLPLVFLVFAGTALLLYCIEGLMLRMALVMVWGFLFGFIPVGWSAWIAHTLSHKAELAGGLSVAVIQFSMGAVAALGGFTFDRVGIGGNCLLGFFFLVAAYALLRLCFTLHSRVIRE